MQEVRELLDGVAIGAAGFDRLDAELRFHAATAARLQNERMKNVNLARINLKEMQKTEMAGEEAKGWETLYRDERRKRMWGGAWKWVIIVGEACAIATLAIQQ